MRKILFCFSGSQYHETTKRIVEDGPKFGATDVWVYDDFWLRTKRLQHWSDTKHLWTRPSPLNSSSRGRVPGVNYFAWKPYVTLDALNRCGPDDIVLYVDADTYPVSDLNPCFDVAKREDRMIFKCEAQYHKWWCKRSCYQNMGILTDSRGVPLEHEKYYDAPVPHGCARFMALKPTDENRAFLNDWYRYCLDLDCNTFHVSAEKFGPEQPELREHRCEQAILTNLVLQRGWKMWREACQFGEMSQSKDDRDVMPVQVFFQDGQHTWDPQPPVMPGSSFRNIHD